MLYSLFVRAQILGVELDFAQALFLLLRTQEGTPRASRAVLLGRVDAAAFLTVSALHAWAEERCRSDHLLLSRTPPPLHEAWHPSRVPRAQREAAMRLGRAQVRCASAIGTRDAPA